MKDQRPTSYPLSAKGPTWDGGSPIDRIRSNPIDFEEAARFLIRLAEAVEYAHQHGVLHRDLKPGNVLLEPLCENPVSLDDFNPCLTDFGLAKLIQESLHDTRSSLIVGTPLYMAPEQLLDNSQKESAATEVFAIGVLLFELITHQTPREGLGYVAGLDELRTKEAPMMQSLRPETPDELNTIAAKCLERDPPERYQSAQSLAEDLQRFVDGVPILAKRVGFRERFVRWTKQPERLVVAGRFTIGFQGMMIAWYGIVIVMMTVLNSFPDDEMQRMFTDVIRFSLIDHLPKAWLGWRMTMQRRWSYWPSTLTTLLMLAVFTYSSMNPSYAFEYLYTTQISKINTFSILIACSLLETILHLLAFPAWHRLYRERKMASNE